MEMIKSVLIKNMKALRKERGWNQDTLAERTGYSTSFIADIERGKSWVSPEALERICNAFGVPCERLFSSDENVKIFNMPMNRAIKKLLNVPDEIYELASELKDPADSVWDDIAETLMIAIQQKHVNGNGKGA